MWWRRDTGRDEPWEQTQARIQEYKRRGFEDLMHPIEMQATPALYDKLRLVYTRGWWAEQ